MDRNKQQGLSFLGWLIFLFFVGSLVLVGMKLGPHYLSNYMIKEILTDAKQDQNFIKLSGFQMRRELLSKFSLNNIEYIQDKNISIDERNGQKTIAIDYEVRENIIANIDAILHFHELVSIP